MSDYDSDDALFDSIDIDKVVETQSLTRPKRTRGASTDGSALSVKRQREDTQTSVSIHSEDFDDDDYGESDDDNPHASERLKVAQRLLQETFGYADFRHEQKNAILRILDKKNTLIVFPTGAGKSLCYQIPGIAFEQLDHLEGSRAAGEHGITIVVSPLIALMKDQVDALKKRKVPADCMDSTKTWAEQQLIHAAMRKGQLRILYCAPERLNNEGFVETMKAVRGGVRLLAVDEAHCISEWGHSFRPDYLKIARFSEEIQAERVICLTATATPKVVDDISEAFTIDRRRGVFQTSPYRPNLYLNAMAVESKQAKFPLMFKFLRDNPGPTLVYVTIQQQAVLLAADLREQGFDAEPFHAGIKVEQKIKLQDDFLAGRVRIVVATVAFGMGIDKPDIRNVLHFDLPSTIEEYSQQIGRAGRDGKQSQCMFYICPEDWYLRENFARGDLPSRASLKHLLLDIFSNENCMLPVGDTFKKSHYEQTREFDIRMSPLQTIYAALELRFGLIRAITPEYSEYKFEAMPKYNQRSTWDKSKEFKSIRANATKKAKFYYVDVKDIVSKTELARADVIRKLNELHDTGDVELKAGGVMPRYRILKPLPRTDEEFEELVDKLYADLERREEDAIQRTQAVEELITGDKCLALALAQHFGMELPESKQKCGHCTHCATGQRVVMPVRPPKPVNIAGIQKVLDATDVRDDPRFLARVAFGIKSPRVVQLKLDKHPVFESLNNHEFATLIREFTNACNESNKTSGSTSTVSSRRSK